MSRRRRLRDRIDSAAVRLRRTAAEAYRKAPPIGAAMQGTVKVQGGPLTEQDYKKAAQDGGFTGAIVVGTDLASVRLPAK